MAEAYAAGYTDEMADTLITAAEKLHVREIDDPGAYLGIAIAVSDMVRDLDAALRQGAPWPARWTAGRGESAGHHG